MKRRGDVLLVCSSGGHLLQLYALQSAWQGIPCVWVTEGTSDARSLLATEEVIEAHWPAERSVLMLCRNILLAIRVLRELRPTVLVTTGAAVAVPFVWIARLLGVRIVYIESLTRIERPSLSGRLIAPMAHRVYVQWPELVRVLRGARYAGAVFSRP